MTEAERDYYINNGGLFVAGYVTEKGNLVNFVKNMLGGYELNDDPDWYEE